MLIALLLLTIPVVIRSRPMPLIWLPARAARAEHITLVEGEDQVVRVHFQRLWSDALDTDGRVEGAADAGVWRKTERRSLTSVSALPSNITSLLSSNNWLRHICSVMNISWLACTA